MIPDFVLIKISFIFEPSIKVLIYKEVGRDRLFEPLAT